MNTLIIPIHSFIDVITNSSSETYVTCDKQTVTAIKNILKLFLENANIATPVDEIFDVTLHYKWKEDRIADGEDVDESYENGPVYFKVTVKKEHKKNYGELTKLMNKLNDVFNAEEFEC